MRKDLEEIRKILESIPEHFQILESETDWNIHSDFIQLTEKLALQSYDEKELIDESKKLYSNSTPKDLKIELLVKLGCSGLVESYRILKEFYNNCEDNFKTWCALALQESHILLESKLTDNSSGFISTGLGGKDNCLRFFFVIFSRSGKPFSIAQRKLINIEFEVVGKELNSNIESIDFHDDCACLTLLIPLDVAPDTIIMRGIQNCNELGEFIVLHYFVTNVEIPSMKEISDIVREMRKDIE
ncbi:hypothetical protein OAO55_00100 [Bacteroidales bacterium]|nr:hypothetical protein [Bacteroidales bacterium]